MYNYPLIFQSKNIILVKNILILPTNKIFSLTRLFKPII
jgi:hypothetical protein